MTVIRSVTRATGVESWELDHHYFNHDNHQQGHLGHFGHHDDHLPSWRPVLDDSLNLNMILP